MKHVHLHQRAVRGHPVIADEAADEAGAGAKGGDHRPARGRGPEPRVQDRPGRLAAPGACPPAVDHRDQRSRRLAPRCHAGRPEGARRRPPSPSRASCSAPATARRGRRSYKTRRGLPCRPLPTRSTRPSTGRRCSPASTPTCSRSPTTTSSRRRPMPRRWRPRSRRAFGVSQSDPAVSSISAANMQAFLDGPFAGPVRSGGLEQHLVGRLRPEREAAASPRTS